MFFVRADYGSAPDVEVETVSPLGFVLGKKVAARRVSARDHDLACLRSAATYAKSLCCVFPELRLDLGGWTRRLRSSSYFFCFRLPVAHDLAQFQPLRPVLQVGSHAR